MNDARGRAERLSNANLARPFLHRDQHDVHHADPSERQRDDADDGEELFHVANHATEHQGLERRVPHRDGLPIVGIEPVPARQDRANVTLERPVDVLDPSGAGVERRLQPADHPLLRRDDDVRQRAGIGVLTRHVARHRREGDEDLVVVRAAVVAVLVLLADLPHDGVRKPVEGDGFADNVPLAEQLLGHIEADDCDAPDLLFVLPGKLTPVFELDRADRLILRLDPGDARGRCVVGALHVDRGAFEFRAHNGDHGGVGGQRTSIAKGQPNLPSGPLTPGLQTGAAAPDDSDVLPKLAQHLFVAAPKTLAGRRQHDYRDHPPEDAEHRKEAAQLVGPQVLNGLREGFPHGAIK